MGITITPREDPTNVYLEASVLIIIVLTVILLHYLFFTTSLTLSRHPHSETRSATRDLSDHAYAKTLAVGFSHLEDLHAEPESGARGRMMPAAQAVHAGYVGQKQQQQQWARKQSGSSGNSGSTGTSRTLQGVEEEKEKEYV